MWIMIAGPYRTGSNDPQVWAENLREMNRAALDVFRLGHVPVIGVNLALPIIESAGQDTYAEVMMPLSLKLAGRCDAVLRIGGPSRGADEEVETFRARGLPVYRHIAEIPVGSQPETNIRLATIDEASSIASVLRHAFVEYEPLYTPEAFAATTPTAEQIQNRWNEGPVWVAAHDNAIVGTVAAVLKGAALYVRSMAILPAAQGQRFGRSLLQIVERFATEQNCQRMFLSTTPFLSRAIRLYEQFGFQRSGDGPHDLFDTPLFTMVKPLVRESPPSG